MGASRKSALPYKHSEITDKIIAAFYNLKATPYEVGLQLNFGPQPRFKRKAFENTRKEWWILQQDLRVSA